ncbi:MAG: hypothetical protein A2504_10695 [Bdellovibrionales bacterium RIFOXYD12_FULL_39_22]|nr:MAG: hypothetical protein A2385_14330 [Bdellovibrionales bacterium RIFOXYB1_FULL_39_21]OFZ40411.1 MAG: hypothetical protein A2485_03020 [Bdellovibrionales bacterium RIFOXYC12_FULL_39_17]OFZ49660.1 MAG: hypothetical protein A2404_09480 [Bdellovibrionales bacterium RIFOXYC1_FULL_39_130]OFZ73325.1 MAG: hypothetical protein A2451_00595 [Bdellovibrionales bacterium RIFOXYC2_FULL_39_8]OFZ77330.1 MAG: hypothetical protein A2560_06145 [Bdellovibrionales bacterium RIFOXYD1_FULL_39_84]OFZ95985.1 MAG:
MPDLLKLYDNEDFFTNIMLTLFIGGMFFFYALKYSRVIFEWIENQTFGTRNYIVEKLELLHIEVKAEKITQMLLFLSFGLSIITLGIMTLLGHWWAGIFLGIILSIVGWKIPRPFIDYMVKKRIKQYQNQMIDGLTLLANGIRAGLSLPQAIGMVVDEMGPPLSQEFSLVLHQNKLGAPLEECLENLAARMATEDNRMFISSINILRETGGNLAETFDTIVEIIRERIRLQQKIDSFVANGLLQGGIILCMPLLIGIIYYFSDPEATMLLFTHPLGIVALFVAIFLDLLGAVIILKIVNIKV